MNKVRRLFFLILFPFFPLWAWLIYQVTDTSLEILLSVVLIPIAAYFFLLPGIRFPKYLVFFIIFTLYHLASVYINDLVPPDTNLPKYILSNPNVVACLFFFIIENTDFDDDFIRIMNRNIFIIIILSLLVSIIQIKNQNFFVSPYVLEHSEGVTHLSENRIFSIYSWVGLNSIGVTFPILISILLGFYANNRKSMIILIVSGIVVSFLTKARYVMLSVIIVFSQFFFNSKIQLRKKIYITAIFTVGLIISYYGAHAIGYDIQEVIDERILEKQTDLGSAQTRILSYYVFATKFPEHPILGVGPETREDVVRLLDGRAPFIHIGYLSYLYFYGIIGCSFFFIAIFLLMRDAWFIGKRYNFWGSFYGIATLVFANTTLVYFNFSEMGIVLAVIYMRYFSQKKPGEIYLLKE
jgi:hypothetical protein